MEMIDAIGQVVEEQAVKVMPMVKVRVLPDDIDDVMQDIRLALWVALPKFEGRSAKDTYVQSIARHIVAEYWRKSVRRKKLHELAEKAAMMAVEKNRFTKVDEVRLVMLSASEREVFRLLGYGYTNEEIAKRLFRTISTVRSHLKAIHKKVDCRDRAKVTLMSHKIFSEENP